MKLALIPIIVASTIVAGIAFAHASWCWFDASGNVQGPPFDTEDACLKAAAPKGGTCSPC
jgi:hypothetical protein